MGVQAPTEFGIACNSVGYEYVAEIYFCGIRISFTIYKHIGEISKPNNGWTKEVNYISWDDREPVYDIRTWTEDHAQYGKGVTLTQNEFQNLYELMGGNLDVRMLFAENSSSQYI